jgi:hypothetical protein
VKPTPMWLLPKGFNANENEGREAFLAGEPCESPFGESSASKEWIQGWKAAARKALEVKKP